MWLVNNSFLNGLIHSWPEIPPAVRQVVTRRLARLSPATNALLQVAAAFTGGFVFYLLPPLTGLSEEALLDSIDEALALLLQAQAKAEGVISFLTGVARALKDAGAASHAWEPLVERGLALVGDRRDLPWARLMLLRGQIER